MPEVTEQRAIKKEGSIFPCLLFIVLHGNKTSDNTSHMWRKKAHCWFSPTSPLWLQYQMHSLTVPSHWIGEGDLKKVVIFRQESFHYGCQTCRKGKRVNNKKRFTWEELTSIFHQYCLGFIQPGFITDAMHFTQAPFMARRCIHFVFQPNKTWLPHRATKTKMDGLRLPC